MEKILEFFKQNYGYAYLKDLKRMGVHTSTIRTLLNSGVIEKIKPGLYRLTDFPLMEYQSFIDIYMGVPRAVICLHSALSYYQLTTTVPSLVMVAIPREYKPPVFQYPPVKYFFYSKKYYESGIEIVRTDSGIFKIYDKEKTIIDCFRYRNRLGEEVAVEGLKKYVLSKNKDLNKLFYYAREGKMFNIIKPYVEALM